MRWFDKGEIKNREDLLAEDVAYLLEPSLTINVPFNCIFRRHFDYFLAFIMLLTGEALLSLPEELGAISAIYMIIGGFLQGWLLYFFIKHGRRLAWNRNRWKDIEALKKSEKKWSFFVIPSLVMMGIRFYHELQKEDIAETKMVIGATVAFFIGVMGLPFLQAWRAKKRIEKSSAVPIPSEASAKLKT